MKNTKAYLLFLILGTMTFALGLWVYSHYDALGSLEYAYIGFVVIAVVVGLLFGIRRLKNEKEGLPPEDELSIKVRMKAGAIAFSFSLYMWLFILIFTMDTNLSVEVPIGIGIGLMSLIFVILWAYYSKKGVDNGNTH